MKVKKEVVRYLAKRIVDHLKQVEAIEFECDEDSVVDIVDGAINGDLSVEDRLNDEVKAILAEKEETLDENNINYRKMFQMVKNKLARERGLIL
ncbi:MAG: DUF507 family protein [Nitrospinae bacterium]|nr:DUF507 family protein [Nitrospinota bacterium]